MWQAVSDVLSCFFCSLHRKQQRDSERIVWWIIDGIMIFRKIKLIYKSQQENHLLDCCYIGCSTAVVLFSLETIKLSIHVVEKDRQCMNVYVITPLSYMA